MTLDCESPSVEQRLHLLGVEPSGLRAWFEQLDQPRYRVEQVLDWIYVKGAAAFEQMTNLSKTLRAALTERADIFRAELVTESVATDGTRKLLLKWPDGQTVETVWIPDAERHTACLSSQVGCAVGCQFCASGLDGLQRNLTTGEIVEQAVRVSRLVTQSQPATPEARPARLSHIVLMGMGEPLANYDAVLAAIRILNAPWGLNIGARKITLSTVGLPKQIRQLADEGLQLNLALSLHAPEQELRAKLIPWAKMPLTEVLDACRYYFEHTGRELTLEYVLLSGVNMEPQHASQLARIARSLRANVNLLRYNPVPGLPLARPSAESSYTFQALLRDQGVNAHIRTSRGQEIAAACGQLRRRQAESVPPDSTRP
jgi:23S rRNA (adenine2503-C2)-methyltransferase